MNKTAILIALLLASCSTTCPIATNTIQIDSVYVPKTIYVNVFDTIRTVKTVVVVDTQLIALNVDTSRRVIRLAPALGDSYPELQAAINFEQSHGGYKCYPAAGNYYISKPLIVSSIIGQDYGQSYVWLEGPAFAKNAPQGQNFVIICMFDYGFGIGIQQGKGCTLKNIQIIGRYNKAASFGMKEIYGNTYAQWQDGVHSFGRSNPYAGIVVDPFSPPSMYDGVNAKMYDSLGAYYLPNMSLNGSTGINIEGCMVTNFVVGVLVTAGHQQNGEMIEVNDLQLTNNCIGYAFTQCQAKTNTLTRLMVWGGTYNILEGARFGIQSGDGSLCPDVDEVNMAGYNYEFIEHAANSFPVHINHACLESIFKIGELYAYAGSELKGWKVDFASADTSIPSPGVYCVGFNLHFEDGLFRIYNGTGLYGRVPFFGFHYTFDNCVFGTAPIFNDSYGPQTSLYPWFRRSLQYYGGAELQDTMASWNYNAGVGNFVLHKNGPKGYIVGVPQASVNDVLLTSANTDALSPSAVNDYQVGDIYAISHDTAYLLCVGKDLVDGVSYPIIVSKLIFK